MDRTQPVLSITQHPGHCAQMQWPFFFTIHMPPPAHAEHVEARREASTGSARTVGMDRLQSVSAITKNQGHCAQTQWPFFFTIRIPPPVHAELVEAPRKASTSSARTVGMHRTQPAPGITKNKATARNRSGLPCSPRHNPQPFTLSLSKRRARFRQAQPERGMKKTQPVTTMDLPLLNVAQYPAGGNSGPAAPCCRPAHPTPRHGGSCPTKGPQAARARPR